MTPPDPVAAALDQLAAHHERVAQLEEREAGHFATLSGQLTQIANLAAGIGAMVKDHAGALARLDRLDRQVAALAAQIDGNTADDGNPDGYRPGPAPRWWKITGPARQEPVA